jgi:hypothetical protein
MARSVVLSAAAAAVVLSLAVGCAGGGGGEGAANAPSGSGAKGSVLKTIRIQETDYSLKPAEITLKKPGLYALKVVNSGSATHALEVDGEGLEEYSKKIEPGQSTQLRLDLSKLAPTSLPTRWTITRRRAWRAR